jgi:hypothetical protein
MVEQLRNLTPASTAVNYGMGSAIILLSLAYLHILLLQNTKLTAVTRDITVWLATAKPYFDFIIMKSCPRITAHYYTIDPKLAP